MRNWLHQRWERRLHIPGADLVLYLDGELPARKTSKTRRHLDDCWSCRAEKQRLEEAIREYVQMRNTSLAGVAVLPSGSAQRFRRRLAAEDRARHATRGRPHWSPRALVATATAVLVLGIAIARLVTVPRVSADTALGRASAAVSSRMIRVSDPAVIERLSLRRTRPGSPGWTETLVSFSASTAAQDPLWREMHNLLTEYGLDDPWPLSPDAFQRWVARVTREHGAKVICKAQAGGGWEVRVSIPNGLPIREASLVLATDWMPIQESFQVQTADGACEYVLRLLSFEVEARRRPDLPPTASAASPAAAGATAQATAQPDPAPGARDLDEVEIQVQYAVHRTGACLRYPLEIARRGDGIEVSGTVRDEAQRTELIAAIPSKPWLAVKLETPEELLSRRKQPGSVDGRVPDELVQSGTPLGEPLVIAHFRATASPVMASARFMTRAVQLSSEAAEHAWALRRLANAFPSGRALDAGRPSRRLLEEMVCAHAGEIQNRLAELRKQLSEVFPGGGGAPAHAGGELSTAVAGLFERVIRIDHLTRRLFAGEAGQEGDALSSGRELMSCFPDLEVLTAAVLERAASEYRR